MSKQYITIENIKVAYLERNRGRKNTIIFVHGNSISSNNWDLQLKNPLLNKFRLIAIDLPAHGDSDLFPDSDYSLKALGAFLAKTVHHLTGDQSYILVGISLGTNVIAEAIAYNIKPMGIVLISSCIVGQNITLDSFTVPGTKIGVVFTDEARIEDINTYAQQVIYKKDLNHLDHFVKDYLRVKDNFRSKLFKTVQENTYSDQIVLIKSVDLTVMVIFGEEDSIIQTHYLDNAGLNLWRNKIFRLSAASHLANLDKPDQTTLLILSYADQIFR